jgi:hypothetical protein
MLVSTKKSKQMQIKWEEIHIKYFEKVAEVGAKGLRASDILSRRWQGNQSKTGSVCVIKDVHVPPFKTQKTNSQTAKETKIDEKEQTIKRYAHG